MSKELIETGNDQKQEYRANMINFMANPYSDRFEYLYQIVLMLINNSEINNLIEQVGEKESKRLIHNCLAFNRLRIDVIELRKQLYDLTRSKYKGDNLKTLIREIEDRIERKSVNLPIVHIDLIMVYQMLIKRTDLRKIVIKDYLIREGKDRGFPTFRRDYGNYQDRQMGDFNVSEKN